MATIQQRPGKDGKPRYTATIRIKGQKEKSISASFTRLTECKDWITRTEAAIKENRHFKTNESKKHTLGEAIDRYLADVAPLKFKPNELRIRGPILEWWKSEIGYCRLSDLTAKDFAACRDKLAKHGGNKGRPLAAATIKRHFVSIGHVLKICQLEWHWLDQNPLKDGIVELPELPRGIVRFLDDEELARLTVACKNSPNELLYPAFILSVSTGMRQGETMNLYWREPATPPEGTAWGVVNLAENCIILHQTKNGNRRRVPLAGEAWQNCKNFPKYVG
ncbi:tyrosine-type recombinase/integrase [Methylomonas koyamae]|uniref:tyrosine-type recombinase/integrase n=1 Tax=Methylomonas koyamae TaxID=702114 RepID=UPI000A6D9F40|nr:site-specific integrase [Methylomonas koyamae]